MPNSKFATHFKIILGASLSDRVASNIIIIHPSLLSHMSF